MYYFYNIYFIESDDIDEDMVFEDVDDLMGLCD
jgi:hypothetical protein